MIFIQEREKKLFFLSLQFDRFALSLALALIPRTTQIKAILIRWKSDFFFF
jgi:hypothetical protein